MKTSDDLIAHIEWQANWKEFYNDDEGYRVWLNANPDGWVMNNYRRGNGPIPAFKQNMESILKIHNVTEKRELLAKRSSTIPYRKLCCAKRNLLEDFKRTIIRVTRCRD